MPARRLPVSRLTSPFPSARVTTGGSSCCSIPAAEPAAPVRFAQAVGLAFIVVAAAGYLLGAPVLGLVFTAFALLAAFLNAAFGLCLGCEVYLAWRRLRRRPIPSRVPAPGA